MKYFGLIWAGLWRKKARTIFTMLSIVVAFLLGPSAAYITGAYLPIDGGLTAAMGIHR